MHPLELEILQHGVARERSILFCVYNVSVKDTVKIKADLNDLSFVVHNLLEYVCRKCLTVVKKQTGVKTKKFMKGIDCRLTARYRQRCGEINVSMKRN